jgi:hypothetical protein
MWGHFGSCMYCELVHTYAVVHRITTTVCTQYVYRTRVQTPISMATQSVQLQIIRMIRQGSIELLISKSWSAALAARWQINTTVMLIMLTLLVSSASRATPVSAFAVLEGGVAVSTPSITRLDRPYSSRSTSTGCSCNGRPSSTRLNAAAAANPSRSRRGLEQRREGATPTGVSLCAVCDRPAVVSCVLHQYKQAMVASTQSVWCQSSTCLQT